MPIWNSRALSSYCTPANGLDDFPTEKMQYNPLDLNRSDSTCCSSLNSEALIKIYVIKGREAFPMPDSGPMQHNLLQETLKEGGGIPKQEIPLSS